jgi:thioester reductase-like protein
MNSDSQQIFEHLDRWRLCQPDKLLYCFLDARGEEIERHTYSTFLQRVFSLSSFFRDHVGLNQGDRVLLVYPPGLELISALFACVGAGLIPVPTNSPTSYARSSSLHRMLSIIKDCEPAVILSTTSGIRALNGLVADEIVDADNLLKKVLELEWLDTETISDQHGDGFIPSPSDTFLLQYTSGSTSTPKGVIVSTENIIHNAFLVVDHAAPITVSWLPQHHDLGLLGYYIYIALTGGTTYGFATTTFIQRPALWLETITRYGATASSAPNFAFELCLDKARVSDQKLAAINLSTLRFLMAAAEPISVETYRRFLSRFQACGLKKEAFFVAYGLAEFTLAFSNYGRYVLSLDRRSLANGIVRTTEVANQIDDAVHLISCGMPLAGNSLLIIDPETGIACSEKRVGEIWINGPSKCKGYWNHPEGSQGTFFAIPEGTEETSESFLRTGDMGFIHEGELYVCGRQKEMIIIRGENYFPQDIEAAVHSFGGTIRQGSVVAFEHQENGTTAVIVLAGLRHKRALPDGRSIAAAVRANLSLEVDRIIFVDAKSIPKTTSGKLRRLEAKRMWLNGDFEVYGCYVHDHALPLDNDGEIPLEDRSAVAILRKKYGLTGREDYSIVEAGIDSIEMVTLLHDIQQLINLEGAHFLANQVDIRLIQSISIASLFEFVDRIGAIPENRDAQITNLIQKVRTKQLETERKLMLADRRLPFRNPRQIKASPALLTQVPCGDILLTGGTGFLGPFLLKSLLEQTPSLIHVLVRGKDESQSRSRLRQCFMDLVPSSSPLFEQFEHRVRVVNGDLAKPRLGLSHLEWDRLVNEIGVIYHNGATVNYILNYAAMRDVNVMGTSTILKLACSGFPKVLNYISTTFIFGWATKDVLYEQDQNEDMELLDFGYSQSKWVSEQLVLEAQKSGLEARLFRPALITPSTAGEGASFDITLRLLTFMIKHGIGVNALNQVSFTPADVTANNIVAISQLPQTCGSSYHVVRDEYVNMMDVCEIITAKTGREFELYSLPEFVPEVIRRCTKDDLLYPLLDFLVGSILNISAMEFKRYESSGYQVARNSSAWGQADPCMDDTVEGIIRFLSHQGVI